MNITLSHDFPLEIAVGKNRKETSWKNKEIQWSDFLKKISKTHRTAETFQEYMLSKKPRQDEIKDIGGFVGGYLAGGRRKKGSVLNRCLVVLDADFPPHGLWDDFKMYYDCAAGLYSTHKHSKENPRVRLIIPLDRPVTYDEYEPIARHIAYTLRIDRFDHTTYEVERLMYWPSTSSDGEFLFEYQDGERLSADEILNSYTNWKDSSEWPQAERESHIIHRDIKEQQDPLEKKGIVGAFCRTYNIEEAIDQFLSDTYEASDVEGRYTYRMGSTGGGLVVYDGKWTYSHHGTDPTGGLLCNAWDLVRIHKFGTRDLKVREDTPIQSRPSHKAMEDFAMSLPSVRKMITDERNQEAAYDFKDLAEEPGEPDENAIDINEAEQIDTDWKGKLKVDKKGNIYSTVENITLILQNDEHLKGRFTFDEFRQRKVIAKRLPWRKVTADNKYATDRDESKLYHYLETVYGITPVKLVIALDCIYEDNQFHPVRDYLKSLTWDKTERVERLLIDYMGAEDTPYVRAVTRKTLIAAVARVFQPGIKFDNVLTLVGEEGKYKSTIFRKLGKEWFSDSFNFGMLKGKEGSEQIQGMWILEIGEMAGLSKADKNDVKSFLSKCEDTYRPAYGRNTITVRRQGIFVSTTNETAFLQEGHGHRRIWPVKILQQTPAKRVGDDLTDEEINQVWAEAVNLYYKGEAVYLPDELEQAAKDVQRGHTEEHPWAGVFRKFLDTDLPQSWETMNTYERLAWLNDDPTTREEGTLLRKRVCAAELWCEALGKAQKDLTLYIARDIHSVMRTLTDWKETDSVYKYGAYGSQRRGYYLTTEAATKRSTCSEMDELLN